MSRQNTASHPARQVSRDALRASAGVAHPSPDGGADPRTAGPIIQSNWEAMRDYGMSGEDATARMHGDLSIPLPAVMTDPGSMFFHDNQPIYTDSYGPVADILNRQQMVPA